MTTRPLTTSVNTTTDPIRQPMSYQRYLDTASESHIVEWVNEEVICYMPPTDGHQNLHRFLSVLLNLFVEAFNLGAVRYAPFEVKLWPEGPAREPDILFISVANLDKLDEKRFNGGPDMVIEIISPSSASEDRVRKFSQYEQAGVQEYWLIDPRPYQQQADFYRLSASGQYEAASLSDGGRFHSVVLPGFWFDTAWLWQTPLPNPQRAVAEIMLTVDSLPDDVKESYRTLYRFLGGTD